jgi:hypothetical protein
VLREAETLTEELKDKLEILATADVNHLRQSDGGRSGTRQEEMPEERFDVVEGLGSGEASVTQPLRRFPVLAREPACALANRPCFGLWRERHAAC